MACKLACVWAALVLLYALCTEGSEDMRLLPQHLERQAVRLNASAIADLTAQLSSVPRDIMPRPAPLDHVLSRRLVWNAVSQWTSHVSNAASKVMQGPLNAVGNVLESAGQVATDTVNAVYREVGNAWSSVKDRVANFFETMFGRMASLFEAVKSAAIDAWNLIKEGGGILKLISTSFESMSLQFNRYIAPALYSQFGAVALVLNRTRLETLGGIFKEAFGATRILADYLIPWDGIRAILDTLTAAGGKVIDFLTSQTKSMITEIQKGGWWGEFKKSVGGFVSDSSSRIVSNIRSFASKLFNLPFVRELKTVFEGLVKQIEPVAGHFKEMFCDFKFFTAQVIQMTWDSVQSLRHVRRLESELMGACPGEEEDSELLEIHSKHNNRLQLWAPMWGALVTVMQKSCEWTMTALDFLMPVIDGVCWLVDGLAGVIWSAIKFFLGLKSQDTWHFPNICHQAANLLMDALETCQNEDIWEVIHRVIKQKLRYLAWVLAMTEYALRNPDLTRILVGCIFVIYGLVQLFWGSRLGQADIRFLASVFSITVISCTILSAVTYVFIGKDCQNDDVHTGWGCWILDFYYSRAYLRDLLPVVFAAIVTLIAHLSIGRVIHKVKSFVIFFTAGAVFGLVIFVVVYFEVQANTDDAQEEDLLDWQVQKKILLMLLGTMLASGSLCAWIMCRKWVDAVVTSVYGGFYILIGRHMLLSQIWRLGGYWNFLLYWIGLALLGSIFQICVGGVVDRRRARRALESSDLSSPSCKSARPAFESSAYGSSPSCKSEASVGTIVTV